MQTYHVILKSEVSKSFRCQRAANSLDIDTKKKSVHELKVSADLEKPFNVGLILGASGSGKTTLAKKIFGPDCFETFLNPDKPVIDQFPEEYSYDQCAEILSGIGLTSVPCWIRPVKTLSNGQRARAEAALGLVTSEAPVLDEWTSVVDRTVAKVMSHCVQKFARRQKKQIVLLSCHYDVVEWLKPDWVIDCNNETFQDRRLLRPVEREKLVFDVRPVDRKTWRYFSKYHYLSDTLPGGQIYTFGLFHGQNQIGFQCFANYVPTRPGADPIYHSNRVVVHPDYAGLGLGLRMVNICAEYMKSRIPNCDIRAKFSSVPMYRARLKDPAWKMMLCQRQIGTVKNVGSTIGRAKKKDSFRTNVKTYTFRYVGKD